MRQAATRIVRDLRRMADPEKAKFVQRYFGQPTQSLGIDTPSLREVARQWIQRLKPGWRLPEACALCDLLLLHPHMETRAAGVLVLGGFRREFDHSTLRNGQRWLGAHLDNWALVDGFASTVLSPLLRQRPESASVLRRWIRSRSMCTRRAAVVTLVPFARHGEHLELAYQFAEALLAQKEDLMHKAVGWLLREAGKTDAQRLANFLLRHRSAIPRTTVRYAIERFPEPARKQLLEQTRLAPAAAS